MPPPGWVRDQGKAGLVPQLPGACVVVIGADATTKPGMKVKNFSEGYFSAAGASLLSNSYRIIPQSTDSGLCH